MERRAADYRAAGFARRATGMNSFDRAWRGLQRSLGTIGGAILFFAVLTPVALLLRVTGRDLLRLRRTDGVASYWLTRPARGGRQTSMTRQF